MMLVKAVEKNETPIFRPAHADMHPSTKIYLIKVLQISPMAEMTAAEHVWLDQRRSHDSWDQKVRTQQTEQ